jgi:hypothetical protein
MRILFVIITIMVGVVFNSFGSNPADLTSDTRYSPTELYKVTSDDGPWWVLTWLPVKEDVSLYLYGWQGQKSEDRTTQIILAKKATDWLDLDFRLEERWSQAGSVAKQEPGLDLHWKNLGLGILLPLQKDEDIRLGPRVMVGNLTAYATWCESDSDNFVLGLSYTFKQIALTVEGSYDPASEVSQFRMNRVFKTKFGSFVPELRLKETPSDTFVGWALCFMP